MLAWHAAQLQTEVSCGRFVRQSVPLHALPAATTPFLARQREQDTHAGVSGGETPFSVD